MFNEIPGWVYAYLLRWSGWIDETVMWFGQLTDIEFVLQELKYVGYHQ